MAEEVKLDFQIEEGVQLYSGKAEAKANPYADKLVALAETGDETASFAFPNEPHQKHFKYAAGKLREKELYFAFRKEKGDRKETHTRVWWLREAPVRKPREVKQKEVVDEQPKSE